MSPSPKSKDPTTDNKPSVQVTDQQTESPTNHLFMSAFDQFRQTIEAIEELTDALAPHALTIDEENKLIVISQEATNSLDPAQGLLFLRAMKTFLEFSISRRTAGYDRPAMQPTDVPTEQEVSSVFAKAFKDKEVARYLTKLLDTWATLPIRPTLSSILFRSELITLIASFEFLLGGIVGAFLTLHPGAMGGSEKEFSLQDLSELASVEEAVNLAVARRVDSFTRDGVEEWDQWFQRHLKKDLKALSADWNATFEIFLRRNIQVHNEGKVSRQYLASSNSSTPVLGRRLDIDEAYLRNAIDKISILGLSACVYAWTKVVDADAAYVARQMSDVIYQYMLKDKWQRVEGLTANCVHFEKVPQSLALLFRYNNWLARKRLHGLDSIRAELEGWDDSALQGSYRLVRSVLLNDLDTAFSMLPDVIRRKDIDHWDLLEWPALMELRTDERFEKYRVQAMKKTRPAKKADVTELPLVSLPVEPT